MKQEHIVSYTLDELRHIRAAGTNTGTNWDRVLAMTAEESEAIGDDENFEDGELCANHVVDATHFLALDPEVAIFFDHFGQDRDRQMNAVLKAHIQTQQPPA